tara:strand:+ start:1171 stop:1554 length:384 start_codon:yes stop_codon:yes gene_type:complete
MDNFIINKKTGRPLRIGSRAHRRYLLEKIRNNTENKTVLSNIDIADSKKLKKSLPLLGDGQFYCYNGETQSMMVKNKSLKTIEIIQYICSKLPSIIDKIVDGIEETDSREDTKKKMVQIFHDSLLSD